MCGSRSACSRSYPARSAAARPTRAGSPRAGRAGRSSTRRSCRPLRPDAGEGLPRRCVAEYGSRAACRGGRSRWRAPPLRPGGCGGAWRALDVVHYPLTVACRRSTPPPAVTLHDVQHLDLPELFSRAERLFRRSTYERAARGRRRDRPERVRAATRGREARPRAGAGPRDPARGRPRALPPGRRAREPFLLYPARPWPHKNHARLLEAFALLRARASRAAARPDGGRPRGARLPAGRRGRGRVSGTSCVASTAARPASSSRACTRASACRRSRRWRAAARSRRSRPALPRSAATRRCCSTRLIPRRSRPAFGRARRAGALAAARPRARARGSPGTRPPGARGRLRRARRE